MAEKDLPGVPKQNTFSYSFYDNNDSNTEAMKSQKHKKKVLI